MDLTRKNKRLNEAPRSAVLPEPQKLNCLTVEHVSLWTTLPYTAIIVQNGISLWLNRYAERNIKLFWTWKRWIFKPFKSWVKVNKNQLENYTIKDVIRETWYWRDENLKEIYKIFTTNCKPTYQAVHTCFGLEVKTN